MYKLRLIKREFLGSRRFTLLFIVNLCIGLLGFTILDAFKRDFSDNLQNASKSMLTADLRISARRNLTPNEVKQAEGLMPPGFNKTRVHTLYSMAASQTNQALAQIKSIENNFPFYGYLELEKLGRRSSTAATTLFQGRRAWLEKSLAMQLELEKGDSFQLGKATFVVDDILIDESSMRGQTASLAPRLYISNDSLQAAQLIQKGSIVWYAHLYQYKPPYDIEKIERSIDAALKDPQIRVKSHITSGQDNGRVLKYLTDYLSLVALTALALAGLGSSYLFRSYLSQKRKDIAILISVGMSHAEAIRLYILKLTILGGIASVISYLLGSLLLPLSSILFKDLTPLEFTPKMGLTTLAYTFVLAIFYSICICLPALLQIAKIRPAELLQEDLTPYKTIDRKGILALIPAGLGFYGLAIFQSNSLIVGSIFCSSIAVISFLFSIAGMLLIRLSGYLKPKDISVKLALGYIQRKQTEVMLGFLALAIGTTLISLIPVIRSSLEQEIAAPQGQENRSLFMFDIQESQVDDIKALIQSFDLTPLVSPMIRARLIAINDKPFEKQVESGPTREAQEESRMRNRGVNLSYRKNLASSEEIVEGRQAEPMAKDNQTTFEITLERRYADRLEVHLNDVLTFEIQSIPIKGKVVGIRKVKWNSFDPNFFIQFQPGALEDAPKTFVAAVPSLPEMRKLTLQKEIVKSFPNVSIIDVSKLIGKIIALISQMSWILLIMAILSVFSGYVVLFSIANHQVQLRKHDTNLLKILGLSFKKIRRVILFEFALISGTAAFIGGITSIGAAFMMNRVIFETPFLWNFKAPSILWGIIVITSLTTAMTATLRTLRQKPSLQLSS